jgi:hypothetical protein
MGKINLKTFFTSFSREKNMPQSGVSFLHFLKVYNLATFVDHHGEHLTP